MSERDDLAFLTIAEASLRLQEGRLSSEELTSACLGRIARLNADLNAFITITAESALYAARKVDREIQGGGWRGPLHGIPLAVKDNIDTAGIRTTAASRVFRDRVPEEDAVCVARLKGAGAVLVGKLNMHEFAFGTTSLISGFGPVRNPWDPDRIAGGSSGGSAAAVAAGLCLGALGTDTGGSIRLPASCCGIVGLKGSFGRVSTRGVVPLSWSLDNVGPMTRTVTDAALVFEALTGYDPGDPASAPDLSPEPWASEIGHGVKGLRVGVLREFTPDDEAQGAFDAALGVLTALGADLHDVKIDVPWELYGEVLFPEADAYHGSLQNTAVGDYQSATYQRIKSRQVSCAGYVLARRDMETARRTLGSAFPNVDVLVSPTTPGAAPRAAECDTPTALPLTFTAAFNILGAPAISVPCGFAAESNMPVGLQIAAPRGGESVILTLAHAYEQATDWHHRRPPLP